MKEGTGILTRDELNLPDFQSSDDFFQKPREYQLPDDLFQIAATTVFMGYWFGTGVAFLKAGTSNNPIDVITSGAVLRDAAIGAAVAGGVGAFYMASQLVLSKIRRHRGYTSIAHPIGFGSYERKRASYRLSASSFNTWDIRLFLTSQALAVLTAGIMANSGSDQQRQFGDYMGRGIGTVVGCMLGLLFPAMLGQYIAKRYSGDPVEVQEQKWFNESRHDVPFYARLFFGAWIGYVALSVLSTPKDQYGFIDLAALNQSRLIGTVLFASVAFLSPLFFHAMRHYYKYTYLKLNPPNDDPKFQPVHWFRESRMDLPWYVRLFAGVVASATVGLVVENVHQEDHINKSLVYAGGALAMASPFIYTMLEKLFNYCLPSYIDAEKIDAPPPLKLSFDMPWYARAGFSALASAMLADTIRYVTTNPNNHYQLPPSNISNITTGIVMSLAMVTPFLMACVHACGYKNERVNPTENNIDDLTWPWYTRLLGGLWLGALIGTAFANLLVDTSDKSIIAGYIGPEFLGINNEYGAPTTALAFGAIGLLWPIAQLAWDKVQSKGLLESMSCFTTCCSHRGFGVQQDVDPMQSWVP